MYYLVAQYRKSRCCYGDCRLSPLVSFWNRYIILVMRKLKKLGVVYISYYVPSRLCFGHDKWKAIIFRDKVICVVTNNIICFIYLFKVKVWQALYSMYNKQRWSYVEAFFCWTICFVNTSGLCLLLWVKQSDTPLTSINADVEVFLSLWKNNCSAVIVCFLCLHSLLYYTAVVFISLFVDSMKTCYNIC